MRVHVYHDPAAEYFAGGLRRLLPELEVVALASPAALESALADVRVLLGVHPPRELVARAPSLGWVHKLGAGVDDILPNPRLRADVIVTNAHIHGPQIAEHALAVLLALARNLPRLSRQQAEHSWRLVPVDVLEGRTLLVVGAGTIGRALARRARAFEMRVLGIRRSPEPLPEFDLVAGLDALPRLLPQADHVVCALPLTDETRGVFDARAFAAMKRSACFVNVGRGAQVEEEALEQALRSGALRGAALDVFDEEPLPAASPLWELPNLIVTPHVSGLRPDFAQRSLGAFVENLARLERGEPLVGAVDRARGY